MEWQNTHTQSSHSWKLPSQTWQLSVLSRWRFLQASFTSTLICSIHTIHYKCDVKLICCERLKKSDTWRMADFCRAVFSSDYIYMGKEKTPVVSVYNAINQQTRRWTNYHQGLGCEAVKSVDCSVQPTVFFPFLNDVRSYICQRQTQRNQVWYQQSLLLWR